MNIFINWSSSIPSILNIAYFNFLKHFFQFLRVISWDTSRNMRALFFSFIKAKHIILCLISLGNFCRNYNFLFKIYCVIIKKTVLIKAYTSCMLHVACVSIGLYNYVLNQVILCGTFGHEVHFMLGWLFDFLSFLRKHMMKFLGLWNFDYSFPPLRGFWEIYIFQ